MARRFNMLGWVKAVVFFLSLAPLARLGWLGVHGGLGANPIEFITHSLGTWTLVFLLLTLAITPLRRWLHVPALVRLRRMLGLYAFFYAALHFVPYLWLDQFFDWAAIAKDVVKRPFITAGFAALLLLAPLAATSTTGMIRRLGAKRWQRLHYLIYPAAIVAVLHYLWLVKQDLTQPLFYAAALAILLGYRVAGHFRRRWRSADT
ncbi:MAG TPA: sulfoxide reductase heme-binding subunit YedZ [Betaproteobacteria bacterium]|nr:sulfoxide reductase heme-binding subunit YedZ [Betaproteobacteria bacterium]